MQVIAIGDVIENTNANFSAYQCTGKVIGATSIGMKAGFEGVYYLVEIVSGNSAYAEGSIASWYSREVQKL